MIEEEIVKMTERKTLESTSVFSKPLTVTKKKSIGDVK
jgi:hypothetical protein